MDNRLNMFTPISQKLILLVFIFLACEKIENESIINCEEVFLKDNTEILLGIGDGAEHLNPSSELYFALNFDRVTATDFFSTFLWQDYSTYTFDLTEEFIDYLLSVDIEVHAHVLIYPLPSVSPDFLVNFNGSNEEFELLVKNYIQAVVNRFKGKVKSYDLANELFDYNNSQTNPTWLRNRFSSDQEMFDFIARCFRYAHEADPNALLFYNDYGQEFKNNNYEKGNAIFNQILQWKNSGVPIHGYGLQMHTNIYRPLEDIRNALELASKTGLLIHISELDVSLNWADFDVPGVNGGEQNITEVSPELLILQANMYKDIAEIYQKTVPLSQRYGITVWGVSDEDSWLGDNRFEAGTIMANPKTRKPAFWFFLEGLSNKNYDCE